jgi:hypothetical protein
MTSSKPVWAVVRIDHFLEPLFGDASRQESPARLVTVTAVYEDSAAAEAHAARLSATRDPDEIEYFTVQSEAKGELTGEPVVSVGIQCFAPGERLTRDQVVVGPVWPTLAAAEQRDRRDEDEEDTTVRLQTARVRPRRARLSL